LLHGYLKMMTVHGLVSLHLCADNVWTLGLLTNIILTDPRNSQYYLQSIFYNQLPEENYYWE